MVWINLLRCSAREKGDGEVFPVLWLELLIMFRRRTRDGSPPAASIRGLMVLALSSSGAIKRTFPLKLDVPSGMGLPVVIRAARSMASRDLPRPGSPSRMVNWPKGMRFFQSQWSGSDLMSESKVPCISDFTSMCPSFRGYVRWAIGGVGCELMRITVVCIDHIKQERRGFLS